MVENLKKLGTQFREFWRQTDSTAKFGIISTLVVSLVLIIGVGIWSAQPTYVKLTDEVAKGEYENILKDLEKRNIKYELSGNGTVISVEKSKLAAARDILHNYQTSETLETGFGGGFPTASERKAQQIAITEQRLAKSIQKINGIKSAEVHLTIAKDRFVNQKPSKASVMLVLLPKFDLPSHAIDSIADLVSFVPGLTRENVTISDNNGRSYPVSDHAAGSLHGKLEYINLQESRFRKSISNLLDSQVGVGKYSFSVKVDANYVSKSTKSFKRTGEGLETKSIRETDTLDSRSTPGGTPGVAANVTQPAPRNGAGGRSVLRDRSESSKVYDEIESEENELDTNLKQVAVAAYIELPVDEDGQPRLTKEEIVESIKTCIGFDDVTRRDLVTVSVGPIAENPFMADMMDAPAAPLVDDFVLNIVKQSSLGLGVLFAFVIGFLMIRKLNPITVSEPEQHISPERARQLADLSKIANENPEFLSRVIAGWINETPVEEIADTEAGNSQRAAA